MSKSDLLDVAPGRGGKTDALTLTAVQKYEKYHVLYGGEADERKAKYSDMVNTYYDLTLRFYEYGWGESFHFADRWKGESLEESIKRHQHFIAMQLALEPGYKVLDVGCGVGGPLREIARFSNASITGLSNNGRQVTRATELTKLADLNQTCNFVQFDAVYAIGATCHAPDAYECYKEICRVLKPGKRLVITEWCLTDAFDPNNKEHQKIKAEIEIGNALPDIRLTTKCIEAVKQAGFEVIWEKDLAKTSQVPWYLPIDTSHFSLLSLRATNIGKTLIKNSLKALQYLRLAPEGTQRVQELLEEGAKGLVEGGKKEIFTPVYFFVARKPERRHEN